MRIVIAGSSGLIGTALRESYERDGHEVVRLVRRPPRADGEVSWPVPDPSPLAGADVLVNLGGAGLGDRRWTLRYRDAILHSRIDTTRALVRAATALDRPPRVMLSASGIRYYGIDRGDEVLTESSAYVGQGLLARVAYAWEEATVPATEAGIAVCHLRLGLVLSRRGGLLPPILRLFRTRVGVYFAAGAEYWSYVTLTDAIRALRFLADCPGAAGPYNISAPEPVRNKELMRALARATGARALLPVPLPVLRAALGGIAGEVFGGLRVIPHRLTEAGFRFSHPDPDAAVRGALAD
jgi:uncharacterized protein